MHKVMFLPWVKDNIDLGGLSKPELLNFPSVMFEGETYMLQKTGVYRPTEETVISSNHFDCNKYFSTKDIGDVVLATIRYDIDSVVVAQLDVSRFDPELGLDMSPPVSKVVTILPRPPIAYIVSDSNSARAGEYSRFFTYQNKFPNINYTHCNSEELVFLKNGSHVGFREIFNTESMISDSVFIHKVYNIFTQEDWLRVIRQDSVLKLDTSLFCLFDQVLNVQGGDYPNLSDIHRPMFKHSLHRYGAKYYHTAESISAGVFQAPSLELGYSDPIKWLNYLTLTFSAIQAQNKCNLPFEVMSNNHLYTTAEFYTSALADLFVNPRHLSNSGSTCIFITYNKEAGTINGVPIKSKRTLFSVLGVEYSYHVSSIPPIDKTLSNASLIGYVSYGTTPFPCGGDPANTAVGTAELVPLLNILGSGVYPLIFKDHLGLNFSGVTLLSFSSIPLFLLSTRLPDCSCPGSTCNDPDPRARRSNECCVPGKYTPDSLKSLFLLILTIIQGFV